MPTVRLKTEEFQVAVFDGELVGIFDPTFGKVVPRTCPAWMPALTQVVKSLTGLEVVEGGFIGVADQMYFGCGGKWVTVEPGARILCDREGKISVVGVEDFYAAYEPV